VARVVFPASLRGAVEGDLEVQVEARDVRGLFARLEERFPALAGELGEMAVAIDGELIQDPWLEPLRADTEVHVLPRIGGGR